ncbi:MAG: ABC transporter permease [Gaiellaceae bacterium]
MSSNSALAVARDLPRMIFSRPGTGILAFLIILCIAMAPTSKSSVFFTETNWFNIANQSVFVAILAVAMTIVLISGGIDLSVGAVVGLTGGVVAWLMAHGTPLAVAFIAGLATGAILGTINGLVITRLGVPDFIATLALLSVARGLLFVWTDGIPFIDYMTDTYRTIGGLEKLFWQITVPILIALGVAFAAAALLRKTRQGRHIKATGSNTDAARLSGVNVTRVKVAVYAGSGFLAALTGILLAGRLTTVQPLMGAGLELEAIAAAVMGGAALTGGRGSILGAMLGAITLVVIQNIINIFGIEPAWETIVVGAIILMAVSIDRLTTTVFRQQEVRV